jgi:VanZ family protein
MKYLIWVIAEIALVFVLLSLPGSSFTDRTGWLHVLPIDKIVHVILFGSLAWSFYCFFDHTTIQALKSVRVQAWAMIFCIVYGIAMEYYQKMVCTKQRIRSQGHDCRCRWGIIGIALISIMEEKTIICIFN